MGCDRLPLEGGLPRPRCTTVESPPPGTYPVHQTREACASLHAHCIERHGLVPATFQACAAVGITYTDTCRVGHGIHIRLESGVETFVWSCRHGCQRVMAGAATALWCVEFTLDDFRSCCAVGLVPRGRWTPSPAKQQLASRHTMPENDDVTMGSPPGRRHGG